MNTPLCPNCREHMSCVERGLGGVWSCLYCEGAWLSQDRVKALRTELPIRQPSSNLLASPRDAQETRQLLCPSCRSKVFRVWKAGHGVIHCCNGCSGLFFEGGSLQSVAPEAIATRPASALSIGASWSVAMASGATDRKLPFSKNSPEQPLQQ